GSGLRWRRPPPSWAGRRLGWRRLVCSWRLPDWRGGMEARGAMVAMGWAKMGAYSEKLGRDGPGPVGHPGAGGGKGHSIRPFLALTLGNPPHIMTGDGRAMG